MAVATGELAIILKARNQASGAIKEVQNSISGLQNTLGKFLPGITILAGVTAGISFLKSAIQEAGAEELQLRNLQTAIENQGVAWDTVKGQIVSYAEKLQTTTMYMDNEVYTAMQRFINSGMSSAEAMKVMGTAMDFATARGINLETTATLLGKAYTGHTEMLQRYGIEGKTFAGIMDEINNKFGGMAQANMDTYAGQVHRLGAAWSELKETIGQALLPVFASMFKGFADFINNFKLSYLEFKKWLISANIKLAEAFNFIPMLKQNLEALRTSLKATVDEINAMKIEPPALGDTEFMAQKTQEQIAIAKAGLMARLKDDQFYYDQRMNMINIAHMTEVISISELITLQEELNRKKVDATKQVQNEINQMTMDEVSYMKFQMNEKVEVMRKAGVSEVEINQWTAAMNVKIKQAEIKQIANLAGAMGDFFMAVARASASGALKVASVVMSGVKAALLAIEALMAASGPIGIILGLLGLGTAVATTIAAIRELEDAEKRLGEMPSTVAFKPPGEVPTTKPGEITTPAPERVERQPAPINNIYNLNYTLDVGIMMGEESLIDNMFAKLMQRYDERKSLVGT